MRIESSKYRIRGSGRGVIVNVKFFRWMLRVFLGIVFVLGCDVLEM